MDKFGYRFGFAFRLEGDVVGAVDGFFAAEADVEHVEVLHARRSEQSTSAHLTVATVIDHKSNRKETPF